MPQTGGEKVQVSLKLFESLKDPHTCDLNLDFLFAHAIQREPISKSLSFAWKVTLNFVPPCSEFVILKYQSHSTQGTFPLGWRIQRISLYAPSELSTKLGWNRKNTRVMAAAYARVDL